MSTYYLKYRPQTISELDLDSVRNQLTQVLQSDHIPHAFLFSGPRGLGKTSAARILAKAVNCENQETVDSRQNTVDREKTKNLVDTSKSYKLKAKSSFEPCNQCDACVSITKGTAVDVIEIDGASNRGIDDIRALREGILSTPISMHKKIYVIDEVHMLTKEAFNALLKTLEEPPAHVLFIFATTEPHKVPETIVSRTFQVHFHRATNDELKRALKRVIKGEQLTVDEEVLEKIVDKAQGGFRDSHKLLEQLAFTKKHIDLAMFNAIFPVANIDQLMVLLEARDTVKALEWIANQQQQGADWEEVIRTLLYKLKDHLLSFYGIGTSLDISLTEPETNELIQLCMRAGSELKQSLIATLPLELVVVDWGRRQETGDRRQETRDERRETRDERQKMRDERQEIRDKINKKGEETSQVSSLKSQNSNLKSQVLNITIGEFKNKWEDFLKCIQPYNHSVAALLRSSQPFDVSGDTVTIKVYYEFHKGRLETSKCMEIVEKGFEELFGYKPKIIYVLGDKSEKVEQELKQDESLEKQIEEIFG